MENQIENTKMSETETKQLESYTIVENNLNNNKLYLNTTHAHIEHIEDLDDLEQYGCNWSGKLKLWYITKNTSKEQLKLLHKSGILFPKYLCYTNNKSQIVDDADKFKLWQHYLIHELFELFDCNSN